MGKDNGSYGNFRTVFKTMDKKGNLENQFTSWTNTTSKKIIVALKDVFPETMVDGWIKTGGKAIITINPELSDKEKTDMVVAGWTDGETE